MGKVFRYILIASIACTMILTVRIATQELNSSIEYTDYDLQSIAYITAEPTFDPIDYNRPYFGMETSPIESLPEDSDTTQTSQPDSGSTPSYSSSSASSVSAPREKTNSTPVESAKPYAESETEETIQTEKPQNKDAKTETDKDKTTVDNRYAYYKAPAGYEPYYDGDFYLISYPKGWKKSSGGEYSGLVFESEADAQGDKTIMTMISTVLDTDNGLSLFSKEGNEIVNDVIANAGINATVVDKGYATTGNRSAYYFIIEVPDGDKTKQISQYYIFYQEKVLLVEFTGVKGKVSKEHIDKILGSFENK